MTMDYKGKARSDRSIVVGDKGLISARSIRLFFGVSTPPEELKPGQEYLVTITEAPSEEEMADQAEAEKALDALTKAQLIERLVKLRKSELTELVSQITLANQEEEKGETASELEEVTEETD